MDSDSTYKNSPGLPGCLKLLPSGIANGEKADLGSNGFEAYTIETVLFNSEKDHKIGVKVDT